MRKLYLKLLIHSVLCVSFVFNTYAQRVANVEGEYVYVQSANETKAQAENQAIQKAKIEAIANEFGTLVEQTNLTNISNGNVRFHSLGKSEIKGEWLGDTKDPKLTYAIDNKGELCITARVWGKAREIITSKIDIKAYVLRNSTDKRNISEEFISGDEYFVSFKSPVKGYIAIYIMNENGDATRLLPYSDDKAKAYKIEANKEYIFFSENVQNDNEGDYYAHGYIFSTQSNTVEYNRMFILFSPNEFVRPDDSIDIRTEEEFTLPPVVNYKEMQDWLVKNRIRDKQMQIVHRDIIIKAQNSL